MTRKDAMQNEEIWWRTGAELFFVKELLNWLLCDEDFAAITTARISDTLNGGTGYGGAFKHLNRVMSDLEDRMFEKTSFGSNYAFYPMNRAAISDAVEKTREELRELGKRLMEEAHEFDEKNRH